MFIFYSENDLKKSKFTQIVCCVGRKFRMYWLELFHLHNKLRFFILFCMSGLKLKSMADFIFNFGVDNVLSIVYIHMKF